MIAEDGGGLVKSPVILLGLGDHYADRPLRHHWLSNRVHDLGGGRTR